MGSKNTLETDAMNNTAGTFISASMLLQHSSQMISFTKARRFNEIKLNSTNLSNLEYPQTLSKKYSSMGYGKKDIFP